MKALFQKYRLLGLVLIFIISAIIMGQLYFTQEMLIEDMQAITELSVSNLEKDISQWIALNSKVIEDIALYVSFNADNDNGIDYYMKALLKANPSFASLYYGSSENKMINASGWKPPAGFDLTQRPWYQEAALQKQLIYTGVFLNASKDKWIVTIAMPVFGEDGTLAGVVGGDLDVNTVIRQIQGEAGRIGGYAFVLDSKGKLIRQGESEADLGNGLKALNVDFERIVGKKGLEKLNGPSFNGFFAYTPIRDTGWTLGNLVSLKAAYPHYKHMLMTSLILVAALAVVFMVFIRLQKKHFLSPLFQLESGINAINPEKDRTYRINLAPDAGLDTLAATINAMLDKVERQLDQLQRMDSQLKISEERWKFALEGSGAGVWDINFSTQEINYSDSYKQMLGYSANDHIDEFSKLFTLIHPDDAERVRAEVEKHFRKEIACYTTEHRVRCKDGSYKWILDRGKVMVWRDDGEPLRMVGTHSDIDERKKAEEEILYLSYHDKLTGLFNRAYFEAELKRLDDEGLLPISIIMGDLNGLKMANDVFGHATGDRLLKTMADIFVKAAEDKGSVSRIGGDEFAIILPSATVDFANAIVTKIKNACKNVAADIIQPSVALGVGVKEHPDQDVDMLYKQAENMMYNNKLVESQSTRSSIISSLRKTLEEKTHETEAHGQRLRSHAMAIGKIIGLHDNQLNELELLALLHDIGKIAIPDSILEKKGKLTEDEWVIMRKHCEIGYRIAVSTPELAMVANGILHHHERWDGGGYPQALKEKEIPLSSRIIAVADAFDAMTSDRPYHRAIPQEEAVKELERCAGTQFDPKIIEIFIDQVLQS